QQRRQPRPLLIRQIMTLQPFIIHTDDLHQTANKDHGTRPSSIDLLKALAADVRLLALARWTVERSLTDDLVLGVARRCWC
ncbi:hypothetical protein, partial [Nonomuraea typhae]|uniref:hypothetical protein n=1 Tax=Nonomuraea typhae TaxID=2603600 RepID=UPI001CA4D56C